MGSRAIARGTWGADTLSPFALRAGQVVLLRGERGRVPRLPCRRQRGDRVRRPDRRAGCPGAAVRALPHLRTRPRLEGGRARGVRGCAPALPSPSAASDLSRRRGSARRRLRSRSRAARSARFASPCSGSSARATPCRSRGRRIASPACETGARADRRRRGGVDEPQKGFVMALDTLFRTWGRRRRLRDRVRLQTDAPEGFIHFATARLPARALSLVLDATAPDDAKRIQRMARSAAPWRGPSEHGYDRISLNFAPFAALLAADAELEPLQRVRAAGAPLAQGPFPARQLAPLQREVRPGLAAGDSSSCERRADLLRVGIAALGCRGVSPVRRRARAVTRPSRIGLVLALGSSAALNWGYLAQHGAAPRSRRSRSATPSARCVSLFSNLRWVAGFMTGIGGWVALCRCALRSHRCRSSRQPRRAASGSSRFSSTGARARDYRRREWLAVWDLDRRASLLLGGFPRRRLHGGRRHRR